MSYIYYCVTMVLEYLVSSLDSTYSIDKLALSVNDSIFVHFALTTNSCLYSVRSNIDDTFINADHTFIFHLNKK